MVMTSARGRGSAKKSPRCDSHAVGQPRRGDGFLGDGRDDGEIVARAPQMRMALGEDHGELAGGTSDVADRLVLGEVDLLSQRVGIAERDALHRFHELLQPRRVAVELVEHRLAGVLDLVLRLAGPQRLGEIAPESIKPRVAHL
jgi:hypothetical protein